MKVPCHDVNTLSYFALSASFVKDQLVTIRTANGNISCDCQGYRAHKRRSHAIADGHLSECLFAYIMYHRRTHRGPTTGVLTQTINKKGSRIKGRSNPLETSKKLIILRRPRASANTCSFDQMKMVWCDMCCLPITLKYLNVVAVKGLLDDIHIKVH